MPESLILCINFIFAAANYSASVYAGLTMGAARLLLSFGSSELQQAFLPHMLAGRFQGTMALTEPDAGTSLGDLACAAHPVDRDEIEGLPGFGTEIYRIRGERIFISAGDHDGVDNVIHLMLARIEGHLPVPRAFLCLPCPGSGRMGRGTGSPMIWRSPRCSINWDTGAPPSQALSWEKRAIVLAGLWASPIKDCPICSR